MQRYSGSVQRNARPALQVVGYASVTVYLAGTLTEATIYSDNGLTPKDNPITCDADGEYWFYAANGSYDITATAGSRTDTKYGVAIYEPVDSIFAVVTNYGADPTGVDDSTVAIQAAIDASYGKTLYFPIGTYRIFGGLTISDSITLKLETGSILDFSGTTSAAAVTVTGAAASPVSLSSNATVGATSFDLASVSGIAVGDMLRLYSDAIFDVGRTNSRIGEIVFVASVASNTVTTTAALHDSYLTGDNAVIEKITPVTKVEIIGGQIVGATSDNNGSVAFLFYRARNCSIENVSVSRFDSAGIRFRDSVDCVASRCRTESVITSNTGYGVSFMDATQDCRAVGMYSRDYRHAVTTNNTALYGGIPRRCEYADSLVVNTARASLGVGVGGDAIDTHAAAEDIRFRRITVLGSTGQGFNIECPSATIEDCTIIGPQSHGIGIHNEASRVGRVYVKRNTVLWAGRAGGTVGDGIKISSGNNASALGYEWLDVSDNYVTGAALNQLRIGTDATRMVNGGVINGNVLDDRSASSSVNQILYAENAARITISNNLVFSGVVTQSGVRLTDVSSVLLTGNTANIIANSSAVCFWIDGSSTRCVVSANSAIAVTPSSLDGLVFGDSVTYSLATADNNFSECSVEYTRGTGATNSVESDIKTSVDISSDAVTVTINTRVLVVDTEAAAATDNLATINGGDDGQFIVVKSAGNSRDVTVKNGTGNIRCGADFALDNTRDSIMLFKSGNDWHRISTADNGA